ncbi:Pycsar system effector family protein [Sphingobium limneticum]|uniref:Pycsar system effector family protein n=1 Tax=Sphingobium limneticum TaxID=1007511 RepID=UPI003D0033C7
MQNLDIIERQLDRVLGFFPRVDTKAGGLFAVNAAMLTIAAINVQAGDLGLWYIAIPGVLMLVGLAVSYTFLYRCNFPDLKGGQGSLIYFAEVQKRTESVFLKDYEAASDDVYRQDLLGQVWRNSQILCQKYTAIAWAIRSSVLTLLPFAIFLTMTAIRHSRFPVVH